MTKPKTEKQKARKAERRKNAAAASKAVEHRRKKSLSTDESPSGAAMLAQIVNLHIAGYTFEQIGQAVGVSADEIDRLIHTNATQYIKNQPQLRVFVRNWVSAKYTQLIEANWDKATDPDSALKLENQDRVIRVLDSMRKLHGADAPTQTEIKVEAAPEAVEKMVQALAAGQGLGYDTGIFDVFDGGVVDAEVIEEAVAESETVLDESSGALDEQAEQAEGLEVSGNGWDDENTENTENDE